MKTIPYYSSHKSGIISGLFLLPLLFISMSSYSQLTFTAANDGSDYYVYFRWSGLNNACIVFPATTAYIYLGGTNLYTISSAPASYTGTVYNYTNLGPSNTATFIFKAHFTGLFCDYWSGNYTSTVTLARIKPPSNVKATDNDYDTKVKLTWTTSTTDVPKANYNYRIYRKIAGNPGWDAGFPKTVNSSATSWEDTDVVPGVKYN